MLCEGRGGYVPGRRCVCVCVCVCVAKRKVGCVAQPSLLHSNFLHTHRANFLLHCMGIMHRMHNIMIIIAAIAAMAVTRIPWTATLDAHARSSLTRMAECQASAFAAAEVPAFLQYGALLGSIRHAGWIPHDSFTAGNGDLDMGIYLGDRPSEAMERLRETSRRMCNHFIIGRDDWFSRHIMQPLGSPTAYGVRSSYARIFSWRIPFAYLDLDEWVDEGSSMRIRHSSDLPPPRCTSVGEEFVERDGYLLYERVERAEVFPIANCSFDGTQLPCPARPEAMLEAQYGKDWRTPILRHGDLSHEMRCTSSTWVPAHIASAGPGAPRPVAPRVT